MADVTNKKPDNVDGKYYVDDQCIDCRLCIDTAPNNFGHNDDEGYVFVCKQPNGDELLLVEESKEACPVEAIGDDGE
ncbi:ferredoxin [bacterium]|nr:ferredoxin [bacterium]